jgi:glycosyltransferase involved in cell wall biosynthesis
MKTSVIFTTYNSPAWLEKVLWGFFCQSVSDFEIIIADDGSTTETRELIEHLRQDAPIRIKHVWQLDMGFQKCRILNKAVLAAEGDYLIFTDGDCIPRRDFIEQHLRHAAPGRYLSGGYFKLPMNISSAITRKDVYSQCIFSPDWLRKRGMRIREKSLKLTSRRWVAAVLNALIPVKRTWNGHNSSCYKSCVLAVNGFDETMQYGGEDVEFGMRLKNFGIKPKRIRYSSTPLHLDHERGYVTAEMLENNRRILERTRRTQSRWTGNGLDKYMSKLDKLAQQEKG